MLIASGPQAGQHGDSRAVMIVRGGLSPSRGPAGAPGAREHVVGERVRKSSAKLSRAHVSCIATEACSSGAHEMKPKNTICLWFDKGAQELIDALAAGGSEAKRAFEAMMPMKKIDIA